MAANDRDPMTMYVTGVLYQVLRSAGLNPGAVLGHDGQPITALTLTLHNGTHRVSIERVDLDDESGGSG